MKITIELSDAEVKGLKKYLREADSDEHKSVSKDDIKEHIENIVHGNLRAPQEAVSQYILAEEKRLNKS